MGAIGCSQHRRPRRHALLGQAVMHVGGRQQAKAAVMVLGVVPREKDVAMGPDIRKTAWRGPHETATGRTASERGTPLDVLEQRVIDQGLIVAAAGLVYQVLKVLEHRVVEPDEIFVLPGSGLITAPRFACEKSISRYFSAAIFFIT
jgi:hypothetical protein